MRNPLDISFFQAQGAGQVNGARRHRIGSGVAGGVIRACSLRAVGLQRAEGIEEGAAGDALFGERIHERRFADSMPRIPPHSAHPVAIFNIRMGRVEA